MTETKNVKIEDATDAELMTFAVESLNLDIKPKAKRAEIIAAMNPAWEQDYIMVAVKVAPVEHEAVIGAIAPKDIDKAAVQAAQAVASGDAPKSEAEAESNRLVKVLVSEGSGKEGKRPVKVSVNGIQILIPRGKMVTIKHKYMVALNHAVRTEYVQDEDDHDNMIETNVHCYPFQFQGFVDDAPRAAAG